ncbi:MAG TPA: hypothetical protein VLV83_06130 [Acidobacteriota bacterium]|nr:hypothetical protein [Acidobacteriota bacterium]
MKALIRILIVMNLVIFALVAMRLQEWWTKPTLVEEGRGLLLEQVGSHDFPSLRIPDERGVVAFFSKINSSCGAWGVLENLREVAAVKPDLPVLIVLSGAYDEQDAKHLRENFNLPFQVQIADAGLLQAWSEIEGRLGYAVLNKTVLVRQGNKWQPVESPSKLTAERWMLQPGL